MLELETVGTVLGLGLGTEPETMLEPEMKAETEQGNKYSPLHP
jgi:hypothetical protein